MFRVGIGYDVHAFTKGDYVILGGVKIPYSKSITAHSDGDVIFHALTDAMLGTIAAGSIGTHFPPSEPQWENANSEIFLTHAYNLIIDKGYEICNIDLIVVCEEPKIMPYAIDIRKKISFILSLDINNINIKAVTTEKLGALGRKEGIAVQAIVALYKNIIR